MDGGARRLRTGWLGRCRDGAEDSAEAGAPGRPAPLAIGGREGDASDDDLQLQPRKRLKRTVQADDVLDGEEATHFAGDDHLILDLEESRRQPKGAGGAEGWDFDVDVANDDLDMAPMDEALRKEEEDEQMALEDETRLKAQHYDDEEDEDEEGGQELTEEGRKIRKILIKQEEEEEEEDGDDDDDDDEDDDDMGLPTPQGKPATPPKPSTPTPPKPSTPTPPKLSTPTPPSGGAAAKSAGAASGKAGSPAPAPSSAAAARPASGGPQKAAAAAAAQDRAPSPAAAGTTTKSSGAGPVTEEELLAYLRQHAPCPVKQAAGFFRSRLNSSALKDAFKAALRKVAALRGEQKLVYLRQQYQ